MKQDPRTVKRGRTPPMTARQYKQHRIDELDGRLRLHLWYRCKTLPLPHDIASPMFTALARQAIEREDAWLKIHGIKRLAPAEGPQFQ